MTRTERMRRTYRRRGAAILRGCIAELERAATNADSAGLSSLGWRIRVANQVLLAIAGELNPNVLSAPAVAATEAQQPNGG